MFACWHHHVNGKLPPGLRCNKENAQDSQSRRETAGKVMARLEAVSLCAALLQG